MKLIKGSFQNCEIWPKPHPPPTASHLNLAKLALIMELYRKTVCLPVRLVLTTIIHEKMHLQNTIMVILSFFFKKKNPKNNDTVWNIARSKRTRKSSHSEPLDEELQAEHFHLFTSLPTAVTVLHCSQTYVVCMSFFRCSPFVGLICCLMTEEDTVGWCLVSEQMCF